MVRVLIVEDKMSEALRIRTVLEQLGHTVQHITGAASVDDELIISLNNERIEPRDFDVAFVDATLDGKYHGWHLVPTLIHGGVVCIAISAGGQFNLMVQNAGAQLALPKEQVVVALQTGALNLDTMISAEP